MSLRAKLEAVIYATEEPVTLAQLTTLFGAEALAERAQSSGEAATTSDRDEAQASLGLAEPDTTTAESAADDHATGAASDAAIEEAIEHPEHVAAPQADGFAEDPGTSATPSLESTELATREDNARRETRQRDREAGEEIRRLLGELMVGYDRDDRGMEIREIAGGYRVATRPEYHDAVRAFVKSLKPAMKLSLQALETLAVIAYKQPVTAPEISDIRGVDSGGVLGSLISRKLVTTAGRKQVVGRPILYKTTKEFLLRFGLKDLAELPSMEEFEKMAGELAETDLPEQSTLLSEQPEDERPPPQSPAHEAFPEEATTAAEVQAAPEHEGELDEAAIAEKARANVQVDDESAPIDDLPGVHRDTAGRVAINSSPRAQGNGMRDEEY